MIRAAYQNLGDAKILRIGLRCLSTTNQDASSKFVPNATLALRGVVRPGMKLSVGGFGLGGLPETLLNEISKHDEAWDLTIASLTASVDGFGLGKLFEGGKVKRMIASYVGENKNFEKMYFSGKLEVELTPQGTIAARMYAAGAGIPAFFSPAGCGTIYSEGGIPIKYNESGEVEIESPPRVVQEFNGHKYVMEEAYHADLALVKAKVADTRGNLIFHGTSRNANPDCAMSGKITIVEAEEIVEAGALDPDAIHLSGVYVDAVIPAADNEKRIERLRERSDDESEPVITGGRGRILRRAAKEFKNGMYTNLGIGLPTMASNYIPDDVHIELHAENGMMGIDKYPRVGQASPDWINAGKETITCIRGGSAFSSSDSFNMVRGGHLDLTMLGALQVSANGDLASWIIPGKLLKGMGGAMDLVCAPETKVIVTMDHCAKDGSPKLLQECTLPLTGKGVIDRIITDMGVFDIDKNNTHGGAMMLVEIAPGITVDDVRAATGAKFDTVPEPIPLMDKE